jgi:ABC-type lipoprotein release transport system permease subunit
MLVAIAWRNLWRNRRRTIITLVAVAGGLTGMLTMLSMMSGMGDRLLEGLLGSYLGHVQIHREGYRERGGATRTVRDADLVLAATRGTPGVVGATARIYGFAHASIVRGDDEAVRGGGGEDVATPVMALVGLEPAHEGQVTDIPTKVAEGRWFEGEAEIVIGQGLAKRHEIELGDAVLPTAVDMTGAMRGPWAVSDEVPRVVGVLRTGVASFDDRVAFVPRAYLAKLLRMEDQVHEIAVRADDPAKLAELVAAIRASISEARSGDAAVVVPATRPLVVARASAAGAPDGGGAGAEPVTIRLVGVEPRGEGAARGGALAGRFLSRAEDAVLSTAAATALGVALDDRVAVAVPVDCGDEVPAADCPPAEEPFVVAGIVDERDLLGGRFALVSGQVVAGNIAALAPGAVTELGEADRDAVSALTARLHGEVTAPDEVLPWMELAPEVAQMMAAYDVMPVIFFVIIFFAVALGIVNTMLMAIFERTREIGLMRALGMRASKVVAMVMWESVLLAAVGVAAGLALSLPLVWYWESYGMNMGALMTQEQAFDFNGITIDPRLWPDLALGDVVSAVLTIGLMTALSGLWPALRAARLHPTEALRHE